MRILNLLILMFIFCQVSLGQFKEHTSPQKKLFPEKMMITQRFAWGPNSIFRSKNKEITLDTRRKKFKIRKENHINTLQLQPQDFMSRRWQS